MPHKKYGVIHVVMLLELCGIALVSSHGLCLGICDAVFFSIDPPSSVSILHLINPEVNEDENLVETLAGVLIRSGYTCMAEKLNT